LIFSDFDLNNQTGEKLPEYLVVCSSFYRFISYRKPPKKRIFYLSGEDSCINREAKHENYKKIEVIFVFISLFFSLISDSVISNNRLHESITKILTNKYFQKKC